jgi:hypothetical protein
LLLWFFCLLPFSHLFNSLTLDRRDKRIERKGKGKGRKGKGETAMDHMKQPLIPYLRLKQNQILIFVCVCVCLCFLKESRFSQQCSTEHLCSHEFVAVLAPSSISCHYCCCPSSSNNATIFYRTYQQCC